MTVKAALIFIKATILLNFQIYLVIPNKGIGPIFPALHMSNNFALYLNSADYVLKTLCTSYYSEMCEKC